ncbi:hypothetical protein HQ533_00605 [Candidatus Woesearchaeota archaeon]|nr:hypothetical protein [Candidatus Woesearchaeota archaeon]
MKLLKLLLPLIILLLPLISAQSIPVSISIEIIDSEEISGIAVTYTLTSIEETTTGVLATDENGEISIDVFEGFNELEISTEENNFYGKTSFYTNEQTTMTLVLLPVGSARMSIIDKKGKSLENIATRIDCSKNYGVQGYFRTDEFGIVDADYLPVGTCTFRAAIEDFVVSQTVEITSGETETIILQFEDYKTDSNYLGWAIGIIITLVISRGIAYLIKDKPIKKKSSSRKEDIITALNKKEQEVVRFLLEQNKETISQANIVHGAGIAKTSLVRVLDSLEQKNILKIERIGKLKKISFTDRFKSK